jgi:hypothetical protein
MSNHASQQKQQQLQSEGWIGAYHAGKNRAGRKRPPEGLLIPHSVLNDHERGVVIHGWGQLRRYGILVDGLVRADDVVVWMGYFRR